MQRPPTNTVHSVQDNKQQTRRDTRSNTIDNKNIMVRLLATSLTSKKANQDGNEPKVTGQKRKHDVIHGHDVDSPDSHGTQRRVRHCGENRGLLEEEVERDGRPGDDETEFVGLF